MGTLLSVLYVEYITLYKDYIFNPITIIYFYLIGEMWLKIFLNFLQLAFSYFAKLGCDKQVAIDFYTFCVFKML